MLETLRVKNLAIVEQAVVDFAAGLNVITGETGAGKSILIGALGLLLGERADRQLIRAGADQCSVEAVFQLADGAAVDALLAELGIAPCEGGRLVVRRILSASGAGKNLVNDSPTTIQALKRVGDLLVDMHGPHDHQSLLDPRFQLDLLDAFGKLGPRREAYAQVYRRLLDLERERQALQGDDQDVARQIDLLAHQVQEIEAAGLAADEDERLPQEHAVVANSRRILELADGLVNGLTEGEAAAFNRLVAAQQALGELEGLLPPAADWRREAESIAAQIQELSGAVSRHAQGIEADPERLQWLEDRMALLHKLKRKYGGTVAEILASLERARDELRGLQTRGEQIARIETELTRVRQELRAKGESLGGERRPAARALAKAITRQLQDLGFAHGAFDVALRAVEPRPDGLEEIEFGFAPNPGEPMRPLRAIASSGEISRVMLATKAVLAAHDRIPVLVFDEINVNVGGEMGQAVGDKLGGVAAHHQVLCITHLPQVAVHGATHFVVRKQVRQERTFTDIRPVAGEDRVAEIARMLGGRGPRGVAVEHARQMLARA